MSEFCRRPARAEADNGMMVMIAALRRVIKGMHYPLKVMLICVGRCAAYPLSLRHIEEPAFRFETASRRG